MAVNTDWNPVTRIIFLLTFITKLLKYSMMSQIDDGVNYQIFAEGTAQSSICQRTPMRPWQK